MSSGTARTELLRRTLSQKEVCVSGARNTTPRLELVRGLYRPPEKYKREANEVNVEEQKKQ